jgi:hypothetical protein
LTCLKGGIRSSALLTQIKCDGGYPHRLSFG